MKLVTVLLALCFCIALQGYELDYTFDVDKNPLEVFRVDKGVAETGLSSFEPFDDVWLLKNKNVNTGVMLWQSVRNGKLTFQGGLIDGGMRIIMVNDPRNGQGVGLQINRFFANDVELVKIYNGKLEVLSRGKLAKSPRELNVSVELTADKLRAYDGEQLICEAPRPAEAVNGGICIMGTWGARIKFQRLAVKSAQ